MQDRSSEASLSSPDNALLAECKSMAARLDRLERWLGFELSHSRAERQLLERLIHIKEEDVQSQRLHLEAAQRQAGRLSRELGECRSELLVRRRQHSQVSVDNIRLRADKCVELALQ